MDTPRVGSLFDRVAGDYEAVWDSEFGTINDDLHALLELRPGQRLLDVACGHGGPLISMARQAGASKRVVGVDLSARMIDEARAKATRVAAELHIEFIHADMEHFTQDPMNLRAFDVVTLRFGLAYMPAAEGVQNVAKLVAPGGQLGIITSTWRSLWQVSTVAQEAARDLGMMLPPQVHQVPRDESDLRARLTTAGLTPLKVVPKTLTLLRDSGAECVQFLRDSGYVIHPEVEAMPEAMKDLAQAELGRRMDERYKRPDGKTPLDFDLLLAVARA